jgi:integrase
MALTDIAVKSAKPKDKPYKLSDADGMYLFVTTAGKYWRLDYRFLGKRKTLALGVYPVISLADARDKRNDARKSLANGMDPSELKQAIIIEAKRNAAITFEVVAREWHQKMSVKWSEKNAKRTLSLFERNIFPYIGNMPIASIKPINLLETIQRIEKRGNIQTAHRAMMNCGQVFRFAIATERATTDLTRVLKGALAPIVEKHLPSITDPKKIGILLNQIDGYDGSFVTKCALKLAPLVFLRPGELRQAEWAEINLDNSEWRLPAEKMKMKVVHIVPLSSQAVQILKEIKTHTGLGRYVFPGIRSASRPMSENTVNAALRRLGYDKTEVCGHGFRSTASTILHEEGWLHDAIERQLSHKDKDKISGAYNYAAYLPMRAEMMQWWANYLYKLKEV